MSQINYFIYNTKGRSKKKHKHVTTCHKVKLKRVEHACHLQITSSKKCETIKFDEKKGEKIISIAREFIARGRCALRGCYEIGKSN